MFNAAFHQKDLGVYGMIMAEDELSGLVVDMSFKLHKQYGPGLFEIVCEA